MHHITEKGFQAGALVGVAVVIPIVARRHFKANGSLAGATPNLLSAVAASVLWGAGLSTVIGAGRVAQLGSTLTPKEFEEGMQASLNIIYRYTLRCVTRNSNFNTNII